MPDARSAADLLVYAPNGELRAAVEVMAVAGRSEGWAVRTLSNLLEFGAVPERADLVIEHPAYSESFDGRKTASGDRAAPRDTQGVAIASMA